MADCHRLDAKRAKLHGVADADLTQLGLAQDAVLAQLGLEQAEGEAGAVDGHVELFQREGQAADVVLMAVGEKDPDDVAALFQQV